MQSLRQFVEHDYLKLILPLVVLLATIAAGWIVRNLLFRAVRRWAVKSTSHVDILLTQSLSGPIIIWALILGLHLAMETSGMIPDRAAYYVTQTLLVLWIVSLTIMVSQFTGNAVRFYGTRVAGQHAAASLTKNLAQMFVITVGLLILLRHFNIEITPILTALGVGGLAVALALQDTLSNLFGGFYVSVAGQVRLGDYIKINTGEEGYITDISWRSTTIRALANNMIIIPNAKLAQSIVTNYNLPDKQMMLPIPISVSYSTDPDRVERVLLEETTAAGPEVPGLVATAEPVVRLTPGFGDSGLQFTLTCQIAEFADQFRVQHELRKRIWKRFQREGIEMPFPTRTVYLKQE